MGRGMRTRSSVLFAAVCAVGLSAASAASARTVREEPYPTEVTWNAAVRLVRVDFGFAITERDQDLGYFTFQWREGNRTVPGSVELVRADVDGRQGTRVIVQIPQMPTYVESMMLSRLGRKLRQEFGEPPAPRPRQPETPPSNNERQGEQNPSQRGPNAPATNAPANANPERPPADPDPPRREQPVSPVGSLYDNRARRSPDATE